MKNIKIGKNEMNFLVHSLKCKKKHFIFTTYLRQGLK
jgi:hypothetical protein